MWKSSLCDIDAINALINHGMNVNHRYSNLDEMTILNYSVVNKSSVIVELLISKGAELLICILRTDGVLHLSSERRII